jgi:3-oxoadipate enol-lactonase
MHTEIEGPDDAPPLVLLHGGIGTGTGHWGKLVPALAGEHRVYLPDLPGHGRTPLPDGVDYSMTVHAAAVTELLEQLGPPVHVGGFSMGGHAALMVAADRPELFASLTLVGVSIRDHAGLTAWRRQFDPQTFEARNPLWSRYLAKAHAGQGGPDAWREVMQRDSTRIEAASRTAGEFADLACPVLLIRGDRDWAVEAAQYDELRRVWGERAEELVVPNGGHDVQITRWRIVQPALLDFLTRATRPQ